MILKKPRYGNKLDFFVFFVNIHAEMTVKALNDSDQYSIQLTFTTNNVNQRNKKPIRMWKKHL